MDPLCARVWGVAYIDGINERQLRVVRAMEKVPTRRKSLDDAVNESISYENREREESIDGDSYMEIANIGRRHRINRKMQLRSLRGHPIGRLTRLTLTPFRRRCGNW